MLKFKTNTRSLSHTLKGRYLSSTKNKTAAQSCIFSQVQVVQTKKLEEELSTVWTLEVILMITILSFTVTVCVHALQ